jgi:hypothetical protein
MANQRIDDLTAGTPPYPGATLLEISQLVSGTPTTFRAQLSDLLASGLFINPFIVNWDSNTPVVAGTSVVMQSCPWPNLTITSLAASCAGGSFTAEFEIGSTPITGLSAVSVTSTATTTNATAANTMTSGGGPLKLIISNVSGTPTTACLQLNLSVTA